MDQVLHIFSLLPPTKDGWPFYNYTMSRQLELTKNFPIMDLKVVLSLIFGYYTTIWFGIKIMKQRAHRVELGIIPLIHNFLNVALSLYIVVETFRQCFLISHYRACQPMDPTPAGLGVAKVMWVFYASKILEFGDTLIMVLKKNFHQITFLHMYHHSSVFFFWWAIISFAPNGATYFAALQNSVVHIVMYSYYFLVALESTTSIISVALTLFIGYGKKTFLNRSWKYYVTYLQLSQFAVNTAEYAYSRYHNCNGYPAWIQVSQVYKLLTFNQHTYFFYMITMITLFLNFLITSKKAAPNVSANKLGGQKKTGTKSD